MTALKTRVAEILCHPLIGRAITTLFHGRVPSLRSRGWRLAVDAPGVSARTAAQIFWGIYENAELRFVERYLRPDLDVVEIGASIGAVASAIALHQHPARRLVCVEANPQLIDLLRRNVSSNAPGRPVEVVHRAISYSGRTARFGLGPTNTSGQLDQADSGAETVEVPASTLAELLRERDITRCALVADIEGAEAELIDKDADALLRCEQILIELHPTHFEGRDLGVEDLIQGIEAHGFALRARHGKVCVFERPGS